MIYDLQCPLLAHPHEPIINWLFFMNCQLLLFPLSGRHSPMESGNTKKDGMDKHPGSVPPNRTMTPRSALTSTPRASQPSANRVPGVSSSSPSVISAGGAATVISTASSQHGSFHPYHPTAAVNPNGGVIPTNYAMNMARPPYGAMRTNAVTPHPNAVTSQQQQQQQQVQRGHMTHSQANQHSQHSQAAQMAQQRAAHGAAAGTPHTTAHGTPHGTSHSFPPQHQMTHRVQGSSRGGHQMMNGHLSHSQPTHQSHAQMQQQQQQQLRNARSRGMVPPSSHHSPQFGNMAHTSYPSQAQQAPTGYHGVHGTTRSAQTSQTQQQAQQQMQQQQQQYLSGHGHYPQHNAMNSNNRAAQR